MNKPTTKELQMVRDLLTYIGEDPDREGLLETPARFLKAWSEYTRGYREKPEEILKSFEDGAERVDEMVIVRDIPVYIPYANITWRHFSGERTWATCRISAFSDYRKFRDWSRSSADAFKCRNV